ncbi:MAG: DMT family transporter [Desulfuromonadales bacterium]
MPNRSLLPVLAIICATCLGASSGLYIKELSLSSFALSGFRLGVPFLLIMPVVIRKRMLLGPKEHRAKLWSASLLNAIRMFLYILAFKLTTMANAIVLLYLWPIFALIFRCIGVAKVPRPGQVMILLTAFSGVVVMNLHRDFSLQGKDLPGSLFMILSALILAGTMIIFKSTLVTMSETDTLFYQNGIGALIFLPFLVAEIPSASGAHLALGVLYGFLVGVCAFGLFFYALKRLPVFQYSAMTYMEVFFGLLFSLVVLREDMTINLAIGVLMVLSASFLAQQSKAEE